MPSAARPESPQAPGSASTARTSPPPRALATTDLVSNTLPTTLGGVSVKINNKSAYVQYVSATQLNVLAPADTSAGSVAVTVTNTVGTSNTVSTIPDAPAGLATLGVSIRTSHSLSRWRHHQRYGLGGDRLHLGRGWTGGHYRNLRYRLWPNEFHTRHWRRYHRRIPDGKRRDGRARWIPGGGLVVRFGRPRTVSDQYPRAGFLIRWR